MPAVRACNSPVAPCEFSFGYLQDMVTGPVTFDGLTNGVVLGVFIACPYLFGLLLAGAAFGRLARRDFWARLATRLAGWLLLMLAIGVPPGIALTGGPIWPIGWAELIQCLLYLGFPVGVLVHSCAVRRHSRTVHLYRAFVGSLWATSWFGVLAVAHTLNGSGQYGLYVSFLASITLICATVAEARTLCGGTRRRVFWRLLTARLPGHEPGHCRQCGYNLFGLDRMRCPECGRAFTAEEVESVMACPSEARA